jgi:hypothetical protein
MLPKVLLMTAATRFAFQYLRMRAAGKMVGDFVARSIARFVVQSNDLFVGPPERIEPDGLVRQMALIAAILVQMKMGLRKISRADLLGTKTGEQPRPIQDSRDQTHQP